MVHPIILAAGKGTRMGGELPKALVPFKGEPLLRHVLRSVQKALPSSIPTIVVGHKSDAVKESLGTDFHYVIQTEQRGTGHAVLCALPEIPNTSEHIIVFYTDHPLLSEKTITNLKETHLKSNSTVTMGTVVVPHYNDWYTCFNRFGRVIRKDNDAVEEIREWKDATESERAITEVSPSYFCFKRSWLEKALLSLKDNNAAHEYYLTDVIAHAVLTGEPISTIAVEPHEALGINTPEELALAEIFG